MSVTTMLRYEALQGGHHGNLGKRRVRDSLNDLHAVFRTVRTLDHGTLSVFGARHLSSTRVEVRQLSSTRVEESMPRRQPATK